MTSNSVHPYVAYLVLLKEKENRAALAHLRRGLGREPGTEPKTFPYVVRWLKDDMYPSIRDAHFIVASLFALHPDNSTSGNLGTTFYAMLKDSDSIEKRFVNLLNSDFEELHHRLRHAVSLAKSKSVSINYSQLLNDISYWKDDNKRVQQRWARAFWASDSNSKSTNKTDDTKKGKKQ